MTAYLYLEYEKLSEQLNDVCFWLIDALTMEGVPLTKALIDVCIPGYVYEFAIRLRLWPEPDAVQTEPEIENIRLGLHLVSKDERAKFMSFIEHWLTFLHEECKTGPKRTPAEILLQYKEDSGQSWEDLAETLRSNVSVLRRLRNPNYKGVKASTAKALAQIIGCNWQDLMPTKEP